ncbi:trypsin domain-containing protein [Phthorimaea operculella]|nr:trypsin domain-containing protein [Phthorimaea operculella]
MRVFLFLSIIVASAYGLGSEAPVKPVFNYLERSIAVAKTIRETEDAIIQTKDQDKFRNYHHARIVGGSIAPNNMYPYLAGLVLHMTYTDNVGVCGASLISSSHVLTAAHCWFDGKYRAFRVEVVLGSQFLFSGGTRVFSWQVIMHSGWTPSNFENDIAMIYLPNHISFSHEEVRNNTQIRHANLQVMTNSQCTLSYTTRYIKESTLCTSGTGGVSVCKGDSGGPLVVLQDGQYFLIGISSFTADGGCSRGHPSGYARVTSFYNWILQHMW